MLNGSIISLQWGLVNNVQAVTDFLPLLLMQPEHSHAGGDSLCLVKLSRLMQIIFLCWHALVYHVVWW